MARQKKNSETIVDLQQEEKKGFLGRFKLTDSYTSLVLGIIFVFIAGILFFVFLRGDRTQDTSSTKTIEIEEAQEDSQTLSTYTVKAGDDLWNIAEDVYNDGYKWTEIAKANKVTNPNIIHPGNKLNLPKLPVAAVVSNAITGKSYKVVEGDNLWEISVRAYADGYKWPELAKANKLNNPHLIYPDEVLQLPR